MNSLRDQRLSLHFGLLTRRPSLERQIGGKQSMEKEGQEMTQEVARDSVDTQTEAVS